MTLPTANRSTKILAVVSSTSTGAVAVDGYFIVPEGGLVDPAALAQQALQSVQIAPFGSFFSSTTLPCTDDV